MKHKQMVGRKALSVVRRFFPRVDTVNDATSSLEIHVTDRDNKTSKEKDHAGCALAVACKREQRADGVIVSVKTAYVIKGTVATRYKLPESSSREVISFDRHGGFEPGTYTIRAPSPKERLGHQWHGDTHPRSDGKNKRKFHATTNIRTSLKES